MTKSRCVAIIASVAMVLGGVLGTDAGAQTITVERYQHPNGEKDLTVNKTYLEGIKDGLVAYNMSSEAKLFCLGEVPTVLTFEQASDTLFAWLRKRKGNAAGLPLGLALLYSLRMPTPAAALLGELMLRTTRAGVSGRTS